MNIAFLINSLAQAAGTERVTSIIANELVKRGFKVDLFIVRNEGKPFFYLAPEINLHYLSQERNTNIYLHYPVNVYRIRKLLVSRKIDIIIDVCSAMSLMSIPATLFTKAKVITWEHFNANVNWNPITSPAARKLAAALSYKIVTLTQADSEVFQKRYKAKNTTVIPNPITIRIDSKTDLKSKTVLAVGRFEHQKGFDMLLQAWKHCRCKEFGWKLKIVGSGSLKEELEKQIYADKISDTVELQNPVEDVSSLYRDASLFVMSSRFEGLPLVLIEAMAMGLPIVSFDCETGPRDIVKDRVTGRLLPAFDIVAMSKTIDELTSNQALLEEYSINSITYSKKFDINPIIVSWEKLIKP